MKVRFFEGVLILNVFIMKFAHICMRRKPTMVFIGDHGITAAVAGAGHRTSMLVAVVKYLNNFTDFQLKLPVNS